VVLPLGAVGGVSATSNTRPLIATYVGWPGSVPEGAQSLFSHQRQVDLYRQAMLHGVRDVGKLTVALG
jgi:hypothetical protein